MPTSLHLYRAEVVGVDDPEAQGRIRVVLPTTVKKKPATLEAWVQVAAMPLGSLFAATPAYAVGDEVIVAAERLPSSGAVVVGRSQPGPVAAPPGASVTVALPNGQQLGLVADAGGLTVQSAGASVRLGRDGTVEVDAPTVRVTASARVDVVAAQVTVETVMAQFSGVVQCDTLITRSVIAQSYTPGVGNEL